MSVLVVDGGSAVLLEVEFKRRTPFSTLDYFDPTSPKIYIWDSDGTLQVDGEDLIKSATGKYYYICQTGSAWPNGMCKVKATATDGTNSDITTDVDNFKIREDGIT